MNELLKDYPVTIEIPVAWGEMDAFQHVNNTVYFRYFESVRVMYCRQIKYMQFLEDNGIGPILKSIQCDFKLPLTFPDCVTVGVKVCFLEADRFTMRHIAVSHRHKKVAASGDGVIVNFDYRKNKKAKLPEEICKAIRALEGSEDL